MFPSHYYHFHLQTWLKLVITGHFLFPWFPIKWTLSILTLHVHTLPFNWAGLSFLENFAFSVSMTPLLWFVSCISDSFFTIFFVLFTSSHDFSMIFLMAWSSELCLYMTLFSCGEVSPVVLNKLQSLEKKREREKKKEYRFEEGSQTDSD